MKPSGNLAYNCPLVFISDTLLSIFNEAAAGVTSGESALWEGEMKECCGGGGGKARSIPPFAFIVPYERCSGQERYQLIRSIYI